MPGAAPAPPAPSAAPPPSPPATLLDRVHSSCARVVQSSSSSVQLAPPDAFAACARQLDPAAVAAAAADACPARMPIKWDSLEAEITFLALQRLLDFGCGYDRDLRASSVRRGWRETLQYGCFSLALSVKRLDGPWMRACSAYALQSAFGIEAKVEEQLQPGISISKPGPLAPLAAALQQAIVDAGNALEAAGARSLGALILDHLDGLVKAGKPVTAASLVEELADSIPGFQDAGLYTLPGAAAAAAGAGGSDGSSDGSSSSSSFEVVFLRKAQALAADLHARFGQTGEDARFAFADADRLAADSGPVLPAVLTHLGLIRPSRALAETLQAADGKHQLPPGSPEERALRAAAVAAADAVVAAAAAAAAGEQGAAPPFSAAQLGAYLLSRVTADDDGGDGELRFDDGAVLHPHVTTGTLAY